MANSISIFVNGIFRSTLQSENQVYARVRAVVCVALAAVSVCFKDARLACLALAVPLYGLVMRQKSDIAAEKRLQTHIKSLMKLERESDALDRDKMMLNEGLKEKNRLLVALQLKCDSLERELIAKSIDSVVVETAITTVIDAKVDGDDEASRETDFAAAAQKNTNTEKKSGKKNQKKVK